MFSLRKIILLSTTLVVVSSEFLSDGVKKFNFQKAKNDSSEYDFEWVSYSWEKYFNWFNWLIEINFKIILKIKICYKFRYELDNGKIFQGRTYKLNFPYLHVYMMLGADDKIYWVELSTKDEVLDDEPFSKIVRLGKWSFSNWIEIEEKRFFLINLSFLVERNEDKLIFRDDFNEHELSLSTGELKRMAYETEYVEIVWFFEFLLIQNIHNFDFNFFS